MESKRLEILNGFYGEIDEESRLSRSRHGQLEFATTMHYIHKYLNGNARILEIGAGTGRYSIALAKEGYDVTAVELVQKNLDELIKNGEGIATLRAFQGDALDLSRFEDNSFDVTLVFGPMYHLYEPDDVNKALDEAIRVTKPSGVILVAFLSIYGIMLANYMSGNWAAGEEENFTEDYTVRHFEEQLFTGYDICEFEKLFNAKPVAYLSTTGVDWCLEALRHVPDFSIPDEDFDSFFKWYLSVSEKRELLGSTNHLLYICRKRS